MQSPFGPKVYPNNGRRAGRAEWPSSAPRPRLPCAPASLNSLRRGGSFERNMCRLRLEILHSLAAIAILRSLLRHRPTVLGRPWAFPAPATGLRSPPANDKISRPHHDTLAGLPPSPCSIFGQMLYEPQRPRSSGLRSRTLPSPILYPLGLRPLG